MFESLFESLQMYYGMDWMCMAFGMFATTLIGSQKKEGFILGCIACCFGFSVALISQQYGFIFHNAILFTLNARGYLKWRNRARDYAMHSRQEDRRERRAYIADGDIVPAAAE